MGRKRTFTASSLQMQARVRRRICRPRTFTTGHRALDAGLCPIPRVLGPELLQEDKLWVFQATEREGAPKYQASLAAIEPGDV